MDTFVSQLVIAVFGSGEAALLLAGGLLLFAAALAATTGWREYTPMVTDLTRLVNRLGGVRGDRGAAQATFARELAEFDRAFSPGAVESPELAVGWDRFRNGLVTLEDGTQLAGVRAADAFDSLDGSARSLEWWAGILVAVGLVFTFIGIVAALSEVTTALSAAGADVEGAVVGLLAIASTKFWTSVAGVLGSIVLRLLARRRRNRIQALESELYNRLDRCVVIAGPEALALRQLRLLERIEAALSGGLREAKAS